MATFETTFGPDHIELGVCCHNLAERPGATMTTRRRCTCVRY
jgi:hypothetical protein